MEQDNDGSAKVADAEESKAKIPRVIRLPGFVLDGEIGLGDVIKRATSSMGIAPCGGCLRRAAALNARFVFSGRQR